MAVKSTIDIKADISALAALVTLTDLQSILTDIVDSLTAGVTMFSYDYDTEIAEGDIGITHNLGITIFDVIIYNTDTKQRSRPDFTGVDENQITIHWYGDSVTNYEMYFYGKLY